MPKHIAEEQHISEVIHNKAFNVAEWMEDKEQCIK